MPAEGRNEIVSQDALFGNDSAVGRPDAGLADRPVFWYTHASRETCLRYR